MNFLKAGGQIDFVLPPQEEDADQTKQHKEIENFRQQVQETRLLSETVKQIGNASGENTDPSDEPEED